MIYVITHKDFNHDSLDQTIYQILHVGKSETNVSFLRDDTGDSITDKNPNYCELTGLYWIWKNGEEAPLDTTGLVHYRRYFTTRKEDLIYTYFGNMPTVLGKEIIQNALQEYDLIVPMRETIHRTVRQYYADLHCEEDLDITREVIKQYTPEYLAAYDAVMNSHYFYYGNMMICCKEELDAYCEWLFQVLFEVENRNDINKYKDAYQRRVYGFLSERLLQVWIVKNGKKTKEYPVFNTESRRMTVFQKNLSRVRRGLSRLK